MQIIAAGKIVEEKQEIYLPYNILPLDAAGASQAIMQLPEVKSCTTAFALQQKIAIVLESCYERKNCLDSDIEEPRLQIKAGVEALRNIRGLPWPSQMEQARHKSGELDLLDWLQCMFGFQVRIIVVGFTFCVCSCTVILQKM